MTSMAWDQAVVAMRLGHSVRRLSDRAATVLDPGKPDWQGDLCTSDAERAPVIDAGREGCRLMYAWDAEDRPALVFIGADSKQPFVPCSEDRNAVDWRIEA